MKHKDVDTIPLHEIPDWFLFNRTSKEPFIIKQGASAWKSTNIWNIDYLIKSIGDIDINYRKSSSRFHPDFTNPEKIICEEKSSTIHKYIEYLLNLDEEARSTHLISGDNTYIYNHGKFNEKFQPLINDISFDNINIDCVQSIGFWLSTRGCVSWLHYDSNAEHNYNVQILGKKRVFLFSPEETKNLYLFTSNQRHSINFSQVNIVNPDLEQFSNISNTLCYSAIIFPGDILYIPSYWFHSFEHLDNFNVNVNYWWHTPYIDVSPVSLRENFLQTVNQLLDNRFLQNNKYISIAERCKLLQAETGLDLHDFIVNMEKTILLGREKTS